MNEDTRKDNEVHEGDLESVFGGNGLLAHSHSGLAEGEANAQNGTSLVAILGRPCPKCHSMMLPTVPIQGIAPSGPGFVCPTCGYTK